MTQSPAAAAPATPASTDPCVPQRVVKVRRDYNGWVATETLEDYALRYTPQRFRRWSAWRVANTAFGAASFLILEAVGATLLVQYGWANAFWAIVATGLIIFAAGLPISVYAARYGVDMDLLTRGAGFGYIGSTITSLIYATFTFIFFALEAAVMAYALELALDIPPAWGYLICALVVIPLVTHGVSMISRLQMWTQPLWLLMLVVPFVYVLLRNPGAFAQVVHYGGESGAGAHFSLPLFGAALTVGIALITQMGEQADYLRFMPARAQTTRLRWWSGVLLGGPGWVVLGVAKMLGGALLAYLAISHSVPASHAVDPNQMYLAAYEYVFPHYGWAVAATALFVVISQLKINVTNAYAGSLAWSNFFSRLTHSHPGRVVWVVFNTLIAFMLMEMNVFRALGEVLGLYSNIAIAWIMAVVADLVINKPLGWSPRGIEFKRAHLYDINPVGVGAMGLASGLSIAAHLGVFGPLAQAFSALIAMVVALVAAPVIAWATRGRYYLARTATLPAQACTGCTGCRAVPQAQAVHTLRCTVCERDYEVPDMAHCPAYGGHICSLCCTLDARCGDLCKPQAHWGVQWRAALRWLLPEQLWRLFDKGLGHFLLLMLVIAPLLAAVLGLLYHQELQTLQRAAMTPAALQAAQVALGSAMLKAYLGLLLIAGIVAWWLVLAHQSRRVAQEESNRQTGLLVREIALHQQTDAALQSARKAAEEARAVAEAARETADHANQAKSRYLSAISHELRTPLNSILGYAQLMGADDSVPPHRQHAVQVIRRGGEHLLSLIEGTLDVARIESGKLALQVAPMHFAEGMQALADLFALQAQAKGLGFHYEVQGRLPAVVRADEKRLRQIVINLLGNALKFTQQGHVTLQVQHARQMAILRVIDTGPGLGPEEQARIFEPFERGQAATAAGGAGLGLTMAKMLTELMGGMLTLRSAPGQGAVFEVRLFLPSVEGVAPAAAPLQRMPVGYAGPRRRVLVVDNEEADRGVLRQLLAPLGFEVQQADSGHAALAWVAGGWVPDAVFMDLAMPGIDGWETLRRLRALQAGDIACAVVSANAFDRELPNDVGIAPQDFLVKPVRHSELLHWLAQRLDLVWHYALEAKPTATPVQRAQDAMQINSKEPAGDGLHVAAAPAAVPAEDLAPLCQALQLGYVRGVRQALAQLEQAHPAQAALWTQWRGLVQQFDMDGLARAVAQQQAAGVGAAMNAPDVVLIVDDVPDNLSVLHDALDEAGYTVLVATHGEQALQRAAQAQPDIILLDALMPGMDGFEVARRLKADAQTAAIPVVFMTGLTETEHLVAALAAGGVDYVTKPLKPAEVLARMQVHLGTARRARSQAQQALQARSALDAFGYASMTVRVADGRILWQTALARRLLLAYGDSPGDAGSATVGETLRHWMARQLDGVLQGLTEPPRWVLAAPQPVAGSDRRLVLHLHPPMEEGQGGELLVVMREESGSAAAQLLREAFALTAKEAEVLFWVAQGKINRDIADIVGSSPATVKKHLERIHAKLGVETRTAAAALALGRLRQGG